MKTNRLKEILAGIEGVDVAVCGDYALDAYWILDPEGSEVSVETGLHAQAVREQRYTLGGASNVVANMLALRPRSVLAIGVVGDDVFGRELTRQLSAAGADTSGLVVQEEDFDTVTFAKRYLNRAEQVRIDFGAHNRRNSRTNRQLLEHLRDALEHCDAVVLNQQVPGSLESEEFVREANALFEAHDRQVIIVDSRHYSHRFDRVIRKTNEVEAVRLTGVEAERGSVFPIEQVQRCAQSLYKRSGRPVCVTRGERGMLVVDAEGIHVVPGVHLVKGLDPVGAGDTVTSALALSLAAGAKAPEAAEFANYAAAVTVQKLFQTGTASPEEILQLAADPDFIYHPELAEDIRRARYWGDTHIELCCPADQIPRAKVEHAVFDFDGTVSVLREGWEAVMEQVMLRAILGEQYDNADQNVLRRARERVCDYIDKSTGIQTILQMEHLAELVREFGLVPEDQVKDKHAYKQIYDQALMQMIGDRIEGVQRGQLDVSDVAIKGAVGLLRSLADRGVRLYLASGTDREHVEREASVLGVAQLFSGGIYGAVGDVSRYSKKKVIKEIIRDNNLAGPELMVCGDGPVELRECRKNGGLAVGVASDEVRRYGLNRQKRTRLVKAGAHLIVPDFSCPVALLRFLFERT